MFIQRILSLVLTCSVVFYTIAFGKVSAAAERQTPTLSAESAIVMCADNGAVLFEKNADRQMAIASITKIMTALIALEYVQVNDRAVSVVSVVGRSVVGEDLDVLVAVLLLLLPTLPTLLP